MRFDVPDYKSLPRVDRAAANRNRFEATKELNGERAILIDDVLTSGGQAEACREVLVAAGAGAVTILTLAVAQDPIVQYEPCRVCGASMRVRTNRRTGEKFLGCSNWARTGCTHTRDLP
jgi:hypothetical protein